MTQFGKIEIPSTSSITFRKMRGRVSGKASQLVEIPRYGVNGHRYADIGQKAPDCVLQTMLEVTDSTAVASHVNACLAYKGVMVKVTFEDGAYVENVVVLDVRWVDTVYLDRIVGSTTTSGYLVTMQWLVRGS
jgi:hypothetical protein